MAYSQIKEIITIAIPYFPHYKMEFALYRVSRDNEYRYQLMITRLKRITNILGYENEWGSNWWRFFTLYEGKIKKINWGDNLIVEDLIQDEYYESDVPELIITENGHIEEICKCIFECLGDNLKKNFKQKEMISCLEEDRNLIEKLTDITDDLLCHMIKNIGHYNIDETIEEKMNAIWYLNPNF